MENRRPFAPYEGTEPYVFISYSHKDSARVLPILTAMYQHGYRIWYDEGIPWTSEWPAVIEEHLRHCAVCLAFHSQASVESIHCRREIHYALQEKKPFLSAYLEDVQLQHGLGLQLSLYQSIKLFPQTNEFVTQLEREGAFLPCRTWEKESSSYQSKQRNKKLWPVLLPLLLLIVLLGGFSVYRLLSLPQPAPNLPDGASTPEEKAVSWGSTDTHLNEYVALLQKRPSLPSVTVAVIDSGVDVDNPVFADRLAPGYDFVNGDELPQDENGHGTAQAGIIVENTPDNVKVMPVRVLNKNGSGYSSVVSQGIRYAVDNGANVICCTFGGGHSDEKDSAVQYAIDHNVTVVACAGNGQDVSDVCPAHIEACITVSAVGKSWLHSSWSSYGDTVDICAPGEKIPVFTLDKKTTLWDGTTFATSYVAAAVADIIIDKGTDQKPAQIEAALKKAAYDLGDPGWDPYYGAGFLDMGAFLEGNA